MNIGVVGEPIPGTYDLCTLVKSGPRAFYTLVQMGPDVIEALPGDSRGRMGGPP